MSELTMSDAQLIQAAASVADIQLQHDFVKRSAHYLADSLMWNPLTNDGDALRLLAALPSLWSLSIRFGPTVEVSLPWGPNGEIRGSANPANEGTAAAIRRAIVLAATGVAERRAVSAAEDGRP